MVLTPLLAAASAVAAGDDASSIEKMVTQVLEEKLRPLQERVAALEAENSELRRRKAVAVDALGGSSGSGAVGSRRRLSVASPCRWTPGAGCPGDVRARPTHAPARRRPTLTSMSLPRCPQAVTCRGCTEVHEYLEDKLSTHEFAALETCLGTDYANMRASFDGEGGNVTLSNSSGSVGSPFPTPLKVTHASGCNALPALTVQLPTTVASDLSVAGSLTASGVDLVSRLLVLEGITLGAGHAALTGYSTETSSVWDLTNIAYDSATGIISKANSALNNDYDAFGYTNVKVTQVSWTRPDDYNNGGFKGHTRIFLVTDPANGNLGADFTGTYTQDAAARVLIPFGSYTGLPQTLCNAGSVDSTNTGDSGENGDTFSVRIDTRTDKLVFAKNGVHFRSCDANGQTDFYAGVRFPSRRSRAPVFLLTRSKPRWPPPLAVCDVRHRPDPPASDRRPRLRA